MRTLGPNPFLSAHGEATTNGAVSVFGAVSLFNDASAPVYLVVWAYYVVTGNAATLAPLFLAKGKVGANPLQGVPIVSDGPAIAGQVTFGNVAALPTANAYSFNTVTGTAFQLYPFAVLAQGYSLTAYASAAAVALSLGFLWEAVYPDELRARYPVPAVGAILPRAL